MREKRWKHPGAASNHAELMAFFGVKDEETIRRWKKQGMPGRPGHYDLAAITQWLRKKGPWVQQNRKAEPAPDGMLTGAPSPELERYRKARADGAEMDLAERRKELVRMSDTCLWIRSIFWQLRELTARLERRHGVAVANAFADAYNASLESATRLFIELVQNPETKEKAHDDLPDPLPERKRRRAP